MHKIKIQYDNFLRQNNLTHNEFIQLYSQLKEAEEKNDRTRVADLKKHFPCLENIEASILLECLKRYIDEKTEFLKNKEQKYLYLSHQFKTSKH